VELASRVVVALVLAGTSLLAFLVALALSFAMGPLGILVGCCMVALAPVAALRLASPFNKGKARLGTRATIICSWVAAAAGIAVLKGLSIPITQGDAYESVWLIGMATAVVLGALATILCPPERVS
jgi:hypothetical protein